MKKVVMFLAMIISILSFVACKDDSEVEPKYLPFDIKVVDGVGGEWVLTEDNASVEGALRLTFDDGKERKFRCTHFKIYGEKKSELNWWGDEWKTNTYKNFWVSCDVIYSKSGSDEYLKKEDRIVNTPGHYQLFFSGDRNGVWNDYKQYRIFIEVQA